MSISYGILVGLLAGVISTLVMSLSEYPVYRKRGMKSVSEWHMNQAMMARLLHRPAQTLVPQGLLLHFLHGGIAGILFVLVLPLLPFGIPIIATSVAFGLVLWVIALLIMNPVTGIRIRDHSLLSLIVSFVGHLLYGIVLGLVVSAL